MKISYFVVYATFQNINWIIELNAHQLKTTLSTGFYIINISVFCMEVLAPNLGFFLSILNWAHVIN